jgi:hypothetical protein
VENDQFISDAEYAIDGHTFTLVAVYIVDLENEANQSFTFFC